MDKNDLKAGDLIRFHDWGVGGFIFGVIIYHEDEVYHSKLNIWRPRAVYYLQAHGIDSIDLINDVSNINDYELHDFQEFLSGVKDNNIFCNFAL